jgi:hypothetical protein
MRQHGKDKPRRPTRLLYYVVSTRPPYALVVPVSDGTQEGWLSELCPAIYSSRLAYEARWPVRRPERAGKSHRSYERLSTIAARTVAASLRKALAFW